MKSPVEHPGATARRWDVRDSGLWRLAAHPAAVAVLIAVVTIAAFWPVTRAEFLNYDDPQYVTANVHVLTGLTWENMVWAFGTYHASNWHPLTWLSHMLDTTLFGRGPGGPHCVNLALHVANSLLLFTLLRHLTGAHWRSAWVAGLFALHPLHVESVAWVSERKDVLSGLLFLLTLWAYTRYVEKAAVSINQTTDHGPRPTLYASIFHPPSSFLYGLALLLFALGLMSKPMLVTLPFVLLLLDYWPLQRFGAAPVRSRMLDLCRLTREKIPFMLFAAASSAVTCLAQTKALQPLTNFSLADRVGNALVAYARYLGKTFWPAGLALPYPLPGPWPATAELPAALLVLVLCLAATWAARRCPFLFTGWFWFLGMLLPVIGLVQVGSQAMADRYTYLPLIGILILLAWGAALLQVRWKLRPRWLGLAATAALAACGLLTWRQAGYWHDYEYLFRHAAAVTRDNIVALDNIGMSHFARGQLDQAMDYYQQSLRIQPKNAQTLNNVGAVLMAQGKPEATNWYCKALAVDPANVEALYNLGTAMAAQERCAEAINYFEAALKSDPDHLEAHNNLGNALVEVGRLDEAETHYRLALRLRPENAQLHRNLAALYLKQNAVEQAVAEYRLALAQEPRDAAAHYGLGLALALQGKWEAAIQEYKETLRLGPDNPEAEYNLGYAFRSQGRLDEAIPHLQQALRLKPEFPMAHYNLGCVLADQGRRVEALAHLREALRQRPDYKEAGEKLKDLMR
jgi:protein O-mannosyl-transferase